MIDAGPAVLDRGEILIHTAGPEGMAFVFTWLRLSSIKVLDWHRNANNQSKDIAHVQKTIAQRMADKVGEPFARLEGCSPGKFTCSGGEQGRHDHSSRPTQISFPSEFSRLRRLP